MRIVQELIFIEAKVTEGSWKRDVFVDVVKNYLERLKKTTIRAHGLTIQLVMNERPYILGDPNSARKELEKSIRDVKQGHFYKDGKPPKNEPEEKLPTRAEIEHERWKKKESQRRQYAEKEESENL